MNKSLKFYKESVEQDYLTTPISVLRYIDRLEQTVYVLKLVGFFFCFLFCVGRIILLNN